MARAWLEDDVISEAPLGGDQPGMVRTVSTVSKPLHTVVIPFETHPRGRTAYQIGWVLNLLVFLVAVVMVAWGAVDGNNDDFPAGFGWILLFFVAVAGMAIAEQKPQVCTCPEHVDMFERGCPPR